MALEQSWSLCVFVTRKGNTRWSWGTCGRRCGEEVWGLGLQLPLLSLGKSVWLDCSGYDWGLLLQRAGSTTGSCQPTLPGCGKDLLATGKQTLILQAGRTKWRMTNKRLWVCGKVKRILWWGKVIWWSQVRVKSGYSTSSQSSSRDVRNCASC
jgi:hypothetical protein